MIEPKSIPKTGKFLELAFNDPRGFTVDSFKFPLEEENERTESAQSSWKYKLKYSGDDIVVKGKTQEYIISSKTGLFKTPAFTGPYLMLLPMNGNGDTQMHGPTKYYKPYTHTCSGWKLRNIETGKRDGIPVITVHGSYKEAEGHFIYTFNADGSFTIDYNFVTKEEVNPRQLGIVLELPMAYERLSWKRSGYWSTYPDWHIARLQGTATASEGVKTTPVGPRIKPNHEWRHDRTSIGSNDFSSTKHNIFQASLRNESGLGLQVTGNADIHTRSWIEGASIRLLVASYSNGGSERFLRSHAAKEDIKLKSGDEVTGKVNLMINQMTAE
jgi:hypothetical protein